jgi:hypothetical protein
LVLITDTGCRAFPFLLSCGFLLLAGSLFAKSYRIAAVFNQERIKKVHIPDSKLIAAVGLTILVELIFDLLWVTIDPLTPKRSLSSNGITSYSVCTCDHSSVWVGISLSTKAVYLLYGGFVAHATRNVPEQYNESRLIAFILYNLALCGAFGLPLLWLIPTEDIVVSAHIRATLIAYMVLYCQCSYRPYVLVDQCNIGVIIIDSIIRLKVLVYSSS